MKIEYLFHDCFYIEFENCTLLTDYFDSVALNPLALINPKKPCYVLVSHHHKDHFTRNIFSWANTLPDIHYIISKDVYRSCKYLFNPESNYSGPNRISPEKVTVISPGELFNYSNIHIRAFGSTDTGNSYVIECEGKTIYFAGDNNAWTWREESSREEVDDMLRRYMRTLDDISEVYRSFDAAFIPLDPRMGKDAGEGVEIFLERFAVNVVIPMHFELWEDVTEKKKFHEMVKSYSAKLHNIRPLTEPGECLTL